MSRIKSFSALLLVLCVLLSVFTSCSNVTASETSAGDTSDSSTETMTAPETTVRELYGPNVRQLTLKYTSEYDASKMDGNPYIIDSAEAYREYVGKCITPIDQNGKAFDIVGACTYGFESFCETTNDGYILTMDAMKTVYDDGFFTDRVLVVCAYSVIDGTPQRMVTVISETTNNGLLIFRMNLGGPIISDGYSYMVLKFVELDRSLTEGKTVMKNTDPAINAYQKEWDKINKEYIPDVTNANEAEFGYFISYDESETLFLETYGDAFNYIEPWVLKPES